MMEIKGEDSTGSAAAEDHGLRFWEAREEDDRITAELRQALADTGVISWATSDDPSKTALVAMLLDYEGSLKSVLTAPLDVVFAEATASIGAAFIAPAAQIGLSFAFGLAHAHKLAPILPLPSIGPVLFGCASIVISYIPAVRSGDLGIALTCGGIPPFFKVASGSSKVFFGGGRAARMGDFTSHCAGDHEEKKPPGSLEEGFGSLGKSGADDLLKKLDVTVERATAVGVGVFGGASAYTSTKASARSSLWRASVKQMAADARFAQAVSSLTGDPIHDSAIIDQAKIAENITVNEAASLRADAAGKALAATVGLAQTAMDTAAAVLAATMGLDPAIGPSTGAILNGWFSVMVGGFQMPSWDLVASGLRKVGSAGKTAFSRLRDPRSAQTLREMARGTFTPARVREGLGQAGRMLSGHPVDVVTGAVLTDGVDATLRGGWPLELRRRYSSAWSERDSALGRGWSVSIDQALWLEPGQVVVRVEDGREIPFEFPEGAEEADGGPRRGETLVDPVNALRLRSLGAGRWELLAGNGVLREFAQIAGDRGDNDGNEVRRGTARLVRMDGPEGDSIHFEYDECGRLAAARAPGGRALGIRRDPRGRISALTLPEPDRVGEAVVARYDYSSAGDLIAVTDACGGRQCFVYDDHRLVEEVFADGQRYFFTYDRPGSEARCVRTWGEGEVFVRDFIYDPARRTTVVTHGTGEIMVVRADGWGRLLEIDDARGGSRRFEYDGLGRRIRETDPTGAVRCFEYDGLGRLIATVDEEGATRSLEVDGRGRVLAAVDPLGGRARNLFDDAGRLAAVIDAGGATTSITDDGRIARQTDGEGNTLEVERDEHGLPRRLQSAAGATWRLTHDRRGRLVEVVDPRGQARRWTYDACDRVRGAEAPSGERRAFSRDPVGRLLAITGRGATIHRAYDRSGRLARRDDGRGPLVVDRDSDGAPRSITRADGATHTFTRDPAGAVVGELTFDGRARRLLIDLGERCTGVIAGHGARTEITHDRAGRGRELRFSDGACERFAYAGDGRMIAAIRDDAGIIDAVDLERDALGRVTRETQGVGWVASAYDRCGRRIRLRASTGLTMEIDRDGDGRPRALTITQGARRWSIAIRRDRAGAELERALPGEVTAGWRRDPLGRPTVRTILAPFADPSSWDQSLGRPRRSIGERCHDWAGDGELRAIREDGALLLDRDAAAIGGEIEAEAPALTHVRDPGGRVIERVHADGGVDRLRWDGADRLREVVRADGVSVRMDYDALGRRIRRQVGDDDLTTWIWDGDLPLHERRVAKGRVHERTWLFDPESWAPMAVLIDDSPAGRGCDESMIDSRIDRSSVSCLNHPTTMNSSPTMVSIITDLIGAPMLAIDDRGVVRWRGAPAADGSAILPRAGADLEMPLQFPGQFADPITGLHDNHHRVYDPRTRTYLSPDPLGLAGGLDPHAYVDDPWTMIDPLGQAQFRADDPAGPRPGAGAYDGPVPPSAGALISDDDEPHPGREAALGCALTLGVTAAVLGGVWLSAKGC